MKTGSQIMRIAFWVVLGITIAFTSLALNRTLLPPAQDATVTPAQQTSTIIATEETVDEAGSTDEIMLVATCIVVIIIAPILLRRSAWSNKNRK
jgi:hypothetical protein